MAQKRVLAKEEYTVGWVCALTLELTVARCMLDEIHAPVQEQDPSDHNSYVLGRMWEHNVVVAGLPSGFYGTTPAATVTKDMLRTFPSIRFGLLVGIGGAAPSPSHDIRLGDVVVSRPSGTNGGIVQYDRGKVTQAGTFIRTGSLNSPPILLLTTMANLESKHAAEDNQITHFVEGMINKFPKLKKDHTCLGEAHDRLYEADYVHLADNATCEVCDLERQVLREPRDSQCPEIHYGSIASSNQVMKDAVIRDRLRDELDVLCFEMEAAGLMQDFPCLVIRGICDYADSHKNKRWQKYAAAVAAGYTKEFLSAIPAARVQQEKTITKLTDALTEIAQDARQHHLAQDSHNQLQETHYQDDKHRDCHRAFAISNYEDHKNINPDRVPGTCRWVLDHPKFVDWKDQPGSDLLWISADPGCGKSVLAKSLIDHDLNNLDTSLGQSLCYFFFKDNETQDRLATALCAVIHQLFAQQPSLISHAMSPWEKTGDQINKGVDALWRIFEDAIADPETRSVTCVFDALDECREEDRSRLVKKLCKLYATSVARGGAHLKLLVTSRAYHSIQDDFQAIPRGLPSIRLRGENENDQIHREIDLVIHQLVADMAADLSLEIETRQQIEQKLLGMNHRTYLWLHLTIGEIRKRLRDSLRPDQASIDVLPASVEEAYEQILQRVTREQRETVEKILLIIVGARRALSIAEMAIALGLAIRPSRAKRLSESTLRESHLERNIRQWCGLFVFVNHSRVYLIHQTAKEFLLQTDSTKFIVGWKHSLTLDRAESIMAHICVEYLLVPDLGLYLVWGLPLPPAFEVQQPETGSTDGIGNQIRASVDTFTKYCAVHWASHLRLANAEIEETFLEVVRLLYNTNSERFQLWFPIFRELSLGYVAPSDLNNIQLAAFNGHDKVLKLLIDNEHPDLEIRDSDGRTALTWPSLLGMTDTVRVLIDAGARVNAEGWAHGNPLYAALSAGKEETAGLLIARGADINLQGGFYGNALGAASFGASRRLIKRLLEQGVDPNVVSKEGFTPLHAAAYTGRHRVVKLLIKFGADPDVKSNDGWTPLLSALYRGHLDVVWQLLELGANPKGLSDRGLTPTLSAIFMERLDWIDLLLEYDYVANVQDLFVALLLLHFARIITTDEYFEMLKHGSKIDDTQELPRGDPDSLDKYEQISLQYHPTLVINRSEYLPQVVLQYSKMLQVGARGSSGQMQYSRFGHLLHLVSLTEHVPVAFQLAIRPYADVNEFCHPAACDKCDQQICDTRHFCTQCDNTDLCGKCFDLHKDGIGISNCVGHPFFPVPLVVWDPEYTRNPGKGPTAKMRLWLQEVEAEMVRRMKQNEDTS